MEAHPSANPIKKIETVKLATVGLVMPNSAEYACAAGAAILDANGETKVYRAIMSVILHFLELAKFLGFSGSSGPSLLHHQKSLTHCQEGGDNTK